MKTTRVAILLMLFINQLGFSQGQPFWNLGGNNVTLGDFMGSTNNMPVVFRTNGFSRLLIDGGASNITGGRIAIGNNLPAGFSPQARLHIHHGFSLGNNEPFIRFTTVTTNTTNTDGFTIGNSSNFNANNNGIVNMNQFEQEPIIVSLPNANPTSPNLFPYEWFRIENA